MTTNIQALHQGNVFNNSSKKNDFTILSLSRAFANKILLGIGGCGVNNQTSVLFQAGIDELYESLDDDFCLSLYENYLDDTDPEKNSSISFQDYIKELNITLS